ncbi:MAG: hypothetical protein J5497_07855 [Selenomonadaceae bacterium]|nr:hypothetical protein [Selenomonadaceae bacterium]
MRLTFSAKYRVGDKVQVLSGEHNFNWQGKVGKVVDVGIDLHAAAYIVEFADKLLFYSSLIWTPFMKNLSTTFAFPLTTTF